MPTRKRTNRGGKGGRRSTEIAAPFRVPGKRVKLTKWIHGTRCVVAVEVDAVIPTADPSEPCLEPATVKWLDELQAMANAGNVTALARVGEVYVRRRSA